MSTLAAPLPPGVGRIGPNAIIQVVRTISDRLSPTFAEAVLRDATPYTVHTLPSEMVDERQARAVVKALVRRLGVPSSLPVLREAGLRTGDYLLAYRIPAAAQLLIRALPRRLGLRVLLGAMRRNAWTFAGSGTFAIVPHGRVPDLVFRECTMCREMHASEAMCAYYAGTFERLITTLVCREAQVLEVECMAQGAPVCRFELRAL